MTRRTARTAIILAKNLNPKPISTKIFREFSVAWADKRCHGFVELGGIPSNAQRIALSLAGRVSPASLLRGLDGKTMLRCSVEAPTGISAIPTIVAQGFLMDASNAEELKLPGNYLNLLLDSRLGLASARQEVTPSRLRGWTGAETNSDAAALLTASSVVYRGG